MKTYEKYAKMLMALNQNKIGNGGIISDFKWWNMEILVILKASKNKKKILKVSVKLKTW